jgi:hypothetical protein
MSTQTHDLVNYLKGFVTEERYALFEVKKRKNKAFYYFS